MNRSENIAELAAALAKAQGEIEAAEKDAVNTFFSGNRYATLASIWEACRGPLSRNGLAVIQSPECEVQAGDRLIAKVTIETLLTHSSGQWISNVLVVPVEKCTAQGVGSAITYGRRYSLASMVGVSPADSDDDGHEASKPAGRPAVRVTSELNEVLEHCRQSIAKADTPEKLKAIGLSLAKVPQIEQAGKTMEFRELYAARMEELQRETVE